MSIQAMAAVLEDVGPEVRGTARLVLLSLANHANDHGECWPSVATISKEAAAHPDTVRDTLKWLEDKHWVVRVIQGAPDARIPAGQRPNLYKLGTWCNRVGRKTPPTLGRNAGPPWGESPADPGANRPTKPSMNRKEPRRGSPQAGDKGGRLSPGSGRISEWQKPTEPDTDPEVAADGLAAARRAASGPDVL